MIFKLENRVPVFEGAGHYVAENASVIGAVTLKNHSSVWFNAVIRADNDVIEIGEHSNIQDGAILHTDAGIPLVLGSGVSVGHRAMLHGCRVGDNTLIGIGSTILNHAVIGENSIVGANSLVTEGKRFPARSLILGSPAKVVRPLEEDEVDLIGQAAWSYMTKSALYRDELVECAPATD
ncbi:MAG: gamma carbonic anhydrase family protein [Woeseiaceae bacterium]